MNRTDKIIEDFKDLMTFACIGRKYNLTTSRIGQIVNKNLDKKTILDIKKQRSYIKNEARLLKYGNRYKEDSRFRKMQIENSKKRYKELKDSQIDKVEFHLRSSDYFETVATTLDLIEQANNLDDMSKDTLSKIINELMYLGRGYKIIKRK